MSTPTLREAAMAALEARFQTWARDNCPVFAPEFEQHRAWAERFAWSAVRDLALTAPEQSPAVDVDALAQHIRSVDGDNRMGAGALAESIVEWLGVSVVPTSGEPTAREAAEALIEAGHEFWLAVGREDYKAQGAVQWLTMDDDALIIFTRGEYRQQLLANIHTLPGSTALIFSEPSDEDADVKSLDAFLRTAPGATPPSAAQAEGASDETIVQRVDRAKRLVNDFARAVAFGGNEARIEAGDRLVAALTAAPEKLEGQADHETALDMLCMMFDCYEDGPACYEDPDEEAGYLGRAVKVSNEDWHKIVDLLNRLRPRVAHVAAPAPHQQAAQPALNPSPLMRSCGVHAQSAALASACATPPSPQQAAQGGEREPTFEWWRVMRMALEAPGCERLHEWFCIGPVQRAAVEHFLDVALAARAAQGERAGVGLTKQQVDFILADSFLAANGSVYSTRVYDFVAAIERACADAWGVKLVTTEGGGE